MRSAIYGVIFTAFLASAGIVQAANELDGKALLCGGFGFVFEQGKVVRWQVEGYSKVIKYTRPYFVSGPRKVYWQLWDKIWNKYNKYGVDRETLQYTTPGTSQKCSVSTKTEIFQKLDEIIATAKKKNKI